MASGLMSAADKKKLDSLSAGTISGLSPVDSSIVITPGEGGASKVGVQISKEPNNALELKGDGLFVSSASSGGAVEFTIEAQEEATDGSVKTYKLKRTVGMSSTYVGDAIEIPKDKVLKSGEFKIVETAEEPYAGAAIGDPYVDLVLDDQNSSHIYIPMKGLVDTVAAGNGVSVSKNTVSIKLDASKTNGLTVGADGIGIEAATPESAGAMTAEDKTALDNVVACMTWQDLSDDVPS